MPANIRLIPSSGTAMSSEQRPIAFLTDFRDAEGCFGRVAGWLHGGLQSVAHPFHVMALATTDPDGNPDARTVVLRGFDPVGREIRFHTDVRAPKLDHIRHQSRVTLLFYDDSVRLQVRIPATATIHHENGTAAAAWGSSAEQTRDPYAAIDGPGVELEWDATAAYPLTPPVDDPTAFGNFVLVTCHFDAMDVLELNSTGHRRAVFTWDGGEVRLTRIAP
jgi:pyridoxamine 5'-phosphate oxidase